MSQGELEPWRFPNGGLLAASLASLICQAMTKLSCACLRVYVSVAAIKTVSEEKEQRTSFTHP